MCFGLFQGKNTFFQKFSKIGLVAEKLILGGGWFRAKSNQDFTFFYFLFLPLINQEQTILLTKVGNTKNGDQRN